MKSLLFLNEVLWITSFIALKSLDKEIFFKYLTCKIKGTHKSYVAKNSAQELIKIPLTERKQPHATSTTTGL